MELSNLLKDSVIGSIKLLLFRLWIGVIDLLPLMTGQDLGRKTTCLSFLLMGEGDLDIEVAEIGGENKLEDVVELDDELLTLRTCVMEGLFLLL